jgi:hypothetical protein
VKVLRIALRYWTPQYGAENKVLDFYDDSNGTSAGISRQIQNRLPENSFSTHNISSYSGNNVAKQKLLNPNTQRADCNARNLHSRAKKLGDKLQISNHFSSSAKHTEELNTIFDFRGEDYDNVLRHLEKRWLR